MFITIHMHKYGTVTKIAHTFNKVMLNRNKTRLKTGQNDTETDQKNSTKRWQV